MANRRKKIKEKAFNIGKRLFPIARELATPVSFLDQVTAKDRQSLGSQYTNAPTTQKLKILTNIVVGRTTGINPFSSEIQLPQTLNPSGILNKWTNAGALMLVYGVLGKGINKVAGMQIAPHTAKVSSVGKRFITGGAIGGFFDDPATSSHGTRQNNGTRQFSPQPRLQQNLRLGNPSTGGDSVVSGMT